MQITHCGMCEDFDRFIHDMEKSPLRSFLAELWFNHQDIRDDTRCWNAYCRVFAPSQVVEEAE